MAHKVFISYKYSEARGLRDRIIEKLGEDARFYTGETSISPDLTDTSTDNIRGYLKNMIWNTSVTIVIISPNLKSSQWIDWEIEYSLKNIERNNRVSRANGIVGIIMKYNSDYTWLETKTSKSDGHGCIVLNDDKLYPIITRNRFNQKIKTYFCDICKTFDILNGSYIAIVNEDDFLFSPQTYIDNAYAKMECIDEYEISKLR